MQTRSTELPPEGFVRLWTVLAHIPVSRATWLEGVRTGRFPRSVKCGRVTMWRVQDIRDLIARLERGEGGL